MDPLKSANSLTYIMLFLQNELCNYDVSVQKYKGFIIDIEDPICNIQSISQ